MVYGLWFIERVNDLKILYVNTITEYINDLHSTFTGATDANTQHFQRENLIKIP